MEARTPRVSTRWAYDAQGRVIAIRQALNGTTLVLRLEYDVHGRLARMVQLALADAQSLAVGFDHQLIEPVHVMVALLDQQGGSVRSLLVKSGVNVNLLRSQLGVLVEKLRERGLYESTAIVVFSDHGDYAGDYGMIEKFLAGFEEPLVRVPLIIRWPGLVPAGSRCDQLVHQTDIIATVAKAVVEPMSSSTR